MILPCLPAAQSRAQAADLRAAIEVETVKGPKAAIALYEKLAQQRADRAVAAKALLRMGQCHEKLGDLGSASRPMNASCGDFKDQKDVVAAAQARLAALGGAASSAETPIVARVWAPAPELCGRASMSADGRYVSIWECNNETHASVHDVLTGQDRTVHNSNCVDWLLSPDASQIACDGGQKGAYELRVIQLRDGSVRTVWRSADESVVPGGWSSELGRQSRHHQTATTVCAVRPCADLHQGRSGEGAEIGSC